MTLADSIFASIERAAREIKSHQQPRYPHGLGSLGSMPVFVRNDICNYHPVTWVTFPKPSRHRSKRIAKKLHQRSAKRGSALEPLCFQTPHGVLMHTSLAAKLRATTPGADRAMNERMIQDADRQN